MHDVRPDITPLRRAIKRLEELQAHARDGSVSDLMRAGLIKQFELAYELSYRALVRYLKFASHNPAEIDLLSFKDQIRLANKKGVVVGELSEWMSFREARALAGEAYENAVADKIATRIPAFLAEVTYLRDRMDGELDPTVPAPGVETALEYWTIVRRALQEFVPDREVLAYGSRITGTAVPFSDLDLAVMGCEPLCTSTLSRLKDALRESDLPFTVDVVDWASTEEYFRAIIRRSAVPVQAPNGAWLDPHRLRA